MSLEYENHHEMVMKEKTIVPCSSQMNEFVI